MHDIAFALGWFGFGAVSMLAGLLLRGLAVQSAQKMQSRASQDALAIIAQRLAERDAGRG